MAKINELQKKRKDILLDMNKKELIVLFNEINKKAIDSIASVKNGFNWNVEEINKANEELVELENILSEKYSNIHGLTASTRFNLLLERYIENTEEAKVLFFYNYFEKNLKYIKSLEMNVAYLEAVLTKFYFKYSFRKWNLETLLLEELDVPENIVYETLEPYIYGSNKFYSKSLENDFNYFIKAVVENIESDVAELKPFLAVEVEPSKFIEEDVIKILEGIIQLQILGTSLIKKYENLLANPFEVAIDVEATVKTENYNNLIKEAKYTFEEKTVEEEKAYLVTVAPKYNFETFELILPTTEEGAVE